MRSSSPVGSRCCWRSSAAYLVARALAQRVKRLELAAERVAAGEFEHPIPVDSTDELGQLAVAFNDMQRQLGQLDLARKKFIATASHELRTPIFSLGGFVELLEDEDLDAETRARFLDQVRNQVERLRKLSVDLLDLSRLESGTLELRPEEVDLGELTRSVSGEFEPTLAQHDSHLELRLAARRIEAVCDPVRVAQIMRILIDNALTHTPPGTRIVVTAGRDDGHVRLAVRDDGDGIETQAVRRIFEPFYTADDAQGSGLGLAIASRAWPTGWRGGCRWTRRRGTRCSRSRSRAECSAGSAPLGWRSGVAGRFTAGEGGPRWRSIHRGIRARHGQPAL